ncbi:MAG: hypothetical protein ACYTFW_05090 [Planctomycetota bacterium]
MVIGGLSACCQRHTDQQKEKNMLNKYQNTIHVPGSLTANLNIRWTVPSPASLVHVSAVASNDSDATMTIGTSADVDGFLAATTIGDSATPSEFDLDDWDGALVSDAGNTPPRLADGDIFVIVIDFDGASGTAADDLTIVLTFTEG